LRMTSSFSTIGVTLGNKALTKASRTTSAASLVD
jgi:hypothetical protein